MLLKHKKAIVIGETKLCIQCAEFLANNKWKIIYVVSDDAVVIDWAKNNSIPTVASSQLNTIKTNGDHFYLFSIVNPYLIPESFLTSKKLLLALNYHDSFLPKYAGVNSTTWAIINNEKQHGVTIHKIESGVDEGDIVAKSAIDIERDETAILLNLKCSERFLSLFQDVITKIESGTLKFLKQDLSHRSYYGLNKIPGNYGIVNGVKNVVILYRLVRGLTFGDGYNNPVSTVKIRLNDKFYIAENFNIDLAKEKRLPEKNTILFDETRDIYGNKTNLKIRYKDILTKFSLSSDDIKYLSDIKTQEKKNKKQILKFLEDHSDASLKALDFVSNEFNNKNYTKEIIIPKYISTTTSLALICLVLTRFFRNSFIVSIYLFNKKIPENLRGLAENRNFIHMHHDMLNDGFANLETYSARLQKDSYVLTKDFGYRYQLQLSTDIAITTGEITATDNHRIVIKIKNNTIEIQGKDFDKLQIDGIAETIEAVFSKELRDDIASKDLRNINILSHSRYEQILYDWNKTEQDYPKNKTIHELFEEQVKKAPDNIAIVHEGNEFTYRELNNKANKLANYLRYNFNIKPDDLVALCLARSELMIIAILGVLKAGGAYVPIDYKHPSKRISSILKNTNPRAAITQTSIKSHLEMSIKGSQISLVVIDDKKAQKKPGNFPVNNLNKINKSTDLAYVIYTSGTTGTPKGVMIEHKSIVNLAHSQATLFSLINNYPLRCLQFASIAFDASVSEIFCALLYGHKLYIASEAQRENLNDLKLLFIESKIQVATLPPSLLKNVYVPRQNFKTLVVAGEVPDKEILDRYYNNGRVRVINAYGPTEAGVCASLNIYNKNGHRNIGKALPNVKLYILSQNLSPVPIRATGELYIGGIGLSRGYLNNAKLTAEKFISNPFQTDEEKHQNENSRLYKTGDLVRISPDGSLEYIGRNDSQVKFMGYRIELGGIESKLSEHPDIKQAIVLVKEVLNSDGKNINDKCIVAYYVADNKLDETRLHGFLAKRLPKYMLPNMFVYLKQLPLTINGKIDVKALPQAKHKKENACKILGAPNEREQLICEAFTEVLGLSKIGINDDFFKLGGSSLTAIRLVSVLQENFNIGIANIFNLKTPKKLAKSENISLTKNFTKHKLEKIKLFYRNRELESKHDKLDKSVTNKANNYLKNIHSLKIDYSLKKPITNVLLTGATGFLGCNLLNQLLELTHYNVYLLVRAKSKLEAVHRISKKYKFYFNKTLDDVLNKRVFVLKSDIEKINIGLTPEKYSKLSEKINSVIHSAALVTLHGEYAKLESANVKATINMLDFTRLTKSKDFHYISTYSVLNSKFTSGYKAHVFTEDDLPSNLEKYDDDAYVKTKLQGEQQVIKYRNYGIKSNVYRTGNLAFMLKDYRAQENIEDNSFFNWLRYIFEVKSIAREISTISVVPTDFAAQSIVKLFDKEQLSNNIYHIFNPYLSDIADIFIDDDPLSIKILPIDKFIDRLGANLNDNIYRNLAVGFLLHQGWLDGWGTMPSTSGSILQDRTQYVLKQLGFEWAPISNKIFGAYIKKVVNPSILGYMDKMIKRKQMLKHIERVAQTIPIPTYWFDVNQRFLGVNKLVIRGFGATSFDRDFANKTPYDLYPQDMAKDIVQHHKTVIESEETLTAPELIENRFGEIKYLSATIAPLRDDDGDLIGTIGISVDVTAEKEAEFVKNENIEIEHELQKSRLQSQEQEKFRKIADQVVHDIRSPLASLLMMVKSCEEKLDEQERIALREAAISIGDIANNLLGEYKENEAKVLAIDEHQPIMLALTLLQLLGEKKHQYKETAVTFIHCFCTKCNFTFIDIDYISFKRMMSNIINNAVDALDGKEGNVSLKLNVREQCVKIIVEDNGKGMSNEIIDKIRNKVAVTAGKKDGHGIGYSQIWETLEHNHGEIEIKSKIGEGTKITLTFPIVKAPGWVTQEIKLNKGDTVVILDDDKSIHHAWRSRFEKYSKEINLVHFTLGEEVIEFINNFSEKEKLFLLADFELLKQDLNGIHVIKRTHTKRATLVTSHYNSSVIRNLVIKSGVKILPKLLASEIPIEINMCVDRNEEDINNKSMEQNKGELKKVDMVLLDDNKMLVDSLASFLESKGKTVDKYYKPLPFLEKLSLYPKDTKICMDNDFQSNINGIELAKRLHEKGYTRLYLFSGKDFDKNETPDFLTIISKTGTDSIYKLTEQ